MIQLNPLTKRQPNWQHVFTVVLLLLLSFALRVYQLGAPEFWFDEAASYFVANRGYLDIIAYVRQAIAEHPPVYYLLLHTWMLFVGASEFALRYFSVWWGILFAALLYRFARRELGERIGLSVALITAASPFVLVFSQEARMYTLLPTLSLLTLMSFLRALRAKQPRHWLLCAVLASIGMATHYYFILVLIGFALYIALQWRAFSRRAWLGWSILGVASIGVGGIWLIVAPGPFATISQAFFDPRIPSWPARLAYVVPDLVLGNSAAVNGTLPLRLCACLVWSLIVYGVRAYAPTSLRRLLLAITVGGLLGVIILPQGVVGRHTAVILPAFLLLLTLGCHELHRRFIRQSSLVIVTLTLIFALAILNQMSAQKDDWGTALMQLSREAQPNDAIVLTNPVVWPLIHYYHRRPDVPVYYLPIPDDELTSEHIADFIQPLLARHPRLWFGITGANVKESEFLMGPWLAAHTFAAQARYQRTVSFYLFVAGAAARSTSSTSATFGERIQLQAQIINPTTIRTGNAILLSLQWQTEARLGPDYLVALKLVDEQGHAWVENLLAPCGGYCLTSDWAPHQPVFDQRALLVPVGTPAGNYRLRLELYNPATRTPVPVRASANGQVVERALEIAAVNIAPNPLAPLPWVEYPVTARFAQTLGFIGYNLAPRTVRAGNAWPIEVVWRAEHVIQSDMIAAFQWLNEEGQLLAESEHPIGTPAYPTSHWQPGVIVRQTYVVPLPHNQTTEPLLVSLQVRTKNSHQPQPISLSLTGAPSAQPSRIPDPYPLPNESASWRSLAQTRLMLTTVKVETMSHQFIAPLLAHPLSAQLGDSFSLIGYETAMPTRGKLDVTLHWRAERRSTTNYKVFVHLISDDERVLAQHDSEPANALRPTTMWLAGEYVQDDHRITLTNQVPSGVYRLVVGLYDPQSGARLPVLTQGSAQPFQRIVLTTVKVP
jgi:uncharacterized membrane protein